jgi:threonine dehydrogenase-like Zn-dependent dehydrogenase
MGQQRGLEVHVFDRVTEGPKPELVRRLGGTYHTGEVKDLPLRPDIIVECTGVSSVVHGCVGQLAGDGILCRLAGVSLRGDIETVDMGTINRAIVLDNLVIFGTVNANRRHWEMAAESLLRADPQWLSGLISRREPLNRWQAALQRRPDDIKVVIDFTA